MTIVERRLDKHLAADVNLDLLFLLYFGACGSGFCHVVLLTELIVSSSIRRSGSTSQPLIRDAHHPYVLPLPSSCRHGPCVCLCVCANLFVFAVHGPVTRVDVADRGSSRCPSSVLMLDCTSPRNAPSTLPIGSDDAADLCHFIVISGRRPSC